MHRASFASTDARLLAVYFSHHLSESHSLGDTMAMSPMGACHIIFLPKVQADAGCRRFLSRIKMNESRDFAGGKLDMNSFFEIADAPHHAVCPQKQFLV